MPFNSLIFTGTNFEACNNRQAPFNVVSGSSSNTSYNSRLISDVRTVKRISFDNRLSTNPADFNFPQAYDPTPTKATNTGFPDDVVANDLYQVYQLNKDGVVQAAAPCLRWVPNADISDLYIQQETFGAFQSIYGSSGTTFNQANAQNTGVVFFRGGVFPEYPSGLAEFAWGSSIESILNIQDVWTVTVAPSSDPADPAQGGTLPATGTIKGISIVQGSVIYRGFIFRYEANSNNEWLTIGIFRIQPNTPPSINVGSLLRSDETINGVPCFAYRITSSESLTPNNVFKRIKFKDNSDKRYFSNSDITAEGRIVRQWNWRSITNVNEGEQAEEIVGELFAWSGAERTLFVRECDPSKNFTVDSGPIYQPAVDAVVGNEGFSTKTNLNPVVGRFVNIKHNTTNQWNSTKNYIESGDNLVQTLRKEVQYDPSYNYLPGEKIIQIQEANTNGDPDSSVDYQYASATVISWSHPDPNNPSDGSPMVLVARIDKYGPDQPGAYGSTNKPFDELNNFAVGDSPIYPVSSYAFFGKILPYRVLKSEDRTWPYEVNGDNSFFTDNKITRQNRSPVPLNSTIGTTRIRAVTPTFSSNSAIENYPIYKFYLFDTQLTENDASFNNVASIGYNESGIIKQIVNIAPVSGKKRKIESFPGTTQTVDVYDTIVFEPTKDKNILKLPTGSIFEDVIASDTLSIEIQKIFNVEFEANQTDISIDSNKGSSPLQGASFLISDANQNWFAVNTDTGEKLNLQIESPQRDTEIGYSLADPSILKLQRFGSTSPLKVTVFAKMSVTFNENNIKTKITKSKIDVLSGLTLQTTGKHKGKYTAKIPVNGVIKTLQSIYLVSDSNGTPVSGGERLDSLFKIDLGVNDQKITNAILVLNPGYTVISGSQEKLKGQYFNTQGTDDVLPSDVFIEISYDYYEYLGINQPGIVTRESYRKSNNEKVLLNEIPFYLSPSDGSFYHESALIDFRPNSIGLTDDFDMGNTKLVPHPDWSDDITVKYYLPRRDKLILNSEGIFEVLYGTPSLTPKYPQDKSNAMTLYLLDKADYVFGPSDVKSKRLENRRYTMRDIGRIDNRVRKLEYYTTLSLLEKSAEDLLVLDANGNDRFKSGILVDTFNGHKIGDVINPDYNIAMDFNAGYARPPFDTKTTTLKITPDTESNTFLKVTENNFLTETEKNKARDNIYMFPYEKEVFVAQPLATRSITVQPHEVTTFEGQGNIWPPVSNWVDRETRPAVRVNLAGENDAWSQMVAAFNNNNLAPFGTQWNEWQTLASLGISSTSTEEEIRTIIAQGNRNNGEFPEGEADIIRGGGAVWRDTAITTLTTTTVTETLLQERNGFFNELTTSTSDVSLGDRIVDVSIQPYMRQAIIRFWASGLKPQSKMYPFFDGINVSEYCYKYNSITDLFNDIADQIPVSYHFATSNISDLKTTDSGEAFIEFRLPAGVFRTGDRKFEITDDPRNDRNKATSYASAVYSASGLRTVSEETVATTRNFEINSTPLPTEQRITDQVTVNVESNTVIDRNSWDPLAQTFFVDPGLYPEGIFLQSVDLFFARKPQANIPVHIQIRPVVNGYPDSKKIYPGAVVYKQRDEVNVSDTPSASVENTITRFTFNRPIHLAPGEHSLVVKSQSSEYEVYIATLGDFLLGTEQRVTNQPYVGVFFTSANASTWTAEQNTDMMMVLNKCKFDTNINYSIELENQITEETLYHTVNLVGSYVDFNSCRTQWELIASPFGGTTLPAITIEPNQNKELPTTCVYNATNKARIAVRASTTNKDVSPIIDLDVMDLFTIRNLVENDSSVNNGETNPYATSPALNSVARARYVSRVVTLEDGFESNNLKCILTINKPQGTNIQVFAKTQDAYSSGEFHENGYVKLKANVDNFDTYYTNNPNDYVEVEFDMEQDTPSPYNKFSIKICLYSENSAFVPKVKDMRAMAVL